MTSIKFFKLISEAMAINTMMSIIVSFTVLTQKLILGISVSNIVIYLIGFNLSLLFMITISFISYVLVRLAKASKNER